MIVRFFVLWTFLFIFNACTGQQTSKTATESKLSRTFEQVSVPVVLTEPAERSEYLVKHYWDKFDFTDTTYISVPEVTEQALSNYIDLMKYVSPEVASSSIKQMMHKAEADSSMFAHFAGLFEKYLYDPNSPVRDETLYISVLEVVVSASVFDDIYKIRPSHLLELALKNRVGEPATDFTYTLANGQKGTLFGLKSDYLLLFFYNPDCDACKEIKAQLNDSPIITELIKSKRLKLLALYPDEDLDAWKKNIQDIPAAWVNAFDSSTSLKNDEIYDLKAIPTLYLLDGEKKVILKDITFNQLEQFLQIQMN